MGLCFFSNYTFINMRRIKCFFVENIKGSGVPKKIKLFKNIHFLIKIDFSD